MLCGFNKVDPIQQSEAPAGNHSVIQVSKYVLYVHDGFDNPAGNL